MYSVGAGEMRPFNSVRQASEYAQQHPKKDASESALNWILAGMIAAPVATTIATAGYIGDRLFHDAVQLYNGEDIDKNGMWVYNPGGWIPSLKFPTITRRGLYSGALINAGLDSGAGFLKVPFNKNALGYIVTGSRRYADRMLRKADGFPGGYTGQFVSRQPGISKGNPHEVFFFPERFPNGSRVFNAGGGKGPRISSSIDNISEGNIQYFTKNYPGREIRTVELFPGKDAVPFEQLKNFEYFGQYGYDGQIMAIPKVRGLYSGKSPYSFYDSGGTHVSIYRDPSDKSLYILQEDALKYLPQDYMKKYFNGFWNKILGKIVTPGLKTLDAVGSPLNIRGNIKKVPSKGAPLGFSKKEFDANLGHIIEGIRNGTISPIQNDLRGSMDLWKQTQNNIVSSPFPRNSLSLTPMIFPNVRTLLNLNEKD